jgi:hypothetical protein
MNNHHMGYWLDATTSIQTHANPYSKEYGTQKKAFHWF